MAKAKIPQTARVIGKAVCNGPDGFVSVAQLWQGYASKGYRSDYQAVETFWFQLMLPDGERVHSMTPAVCAEHVKRFDTGTAPAGYTFTLTGVYAGK
jgi:hypothetical protein